MAALRTLAGLATGLAVVVGPLAAQVNAREMFVSVLDESGSPVPDLQVSDLLVREDGALREVVRVGRATATDSASDPARQPRRSWHTGEARERRVAMGHYSTAAGLLVAAVLASVLSAEAQQRPSFRSGVDVVSLSVTVTGQDNRYITDLTQDDFLVYEDGVQQETTFFTRAQLTISLALLLDTSASMEQRLQTAQEAAVGFASRLRPEDMAEIINFDSRVQILETFTNDQQRLERAIRQTSAGGSTSLYNAIYISLKELKKVRAQTFEDVRRQVIVVLSDGEDTSSLVGFDEVLEQAKRSETVIYSIGLRSRAGRSPVPARVSGSRFRLAAAVPRDRGPGILPEGGWRSRRHLRADCRGALEPVHAGLHLEQSTAGRHVAADRRSCHSPKRHGAHQTGILRAARQLRAGGQPATPVRLAPFAL